MVVQRGGHDLKSNTFGKIRVEIVYGFQHAPLAYLSERARMAHLTGTNALRLQLRETMAPYLPENIELTFSGLCFDRLHIGGRSEGVRKLYFRAWAKTRKPAVFIILKSVAYHLSAGELALLRDKAIAVGLDHMDSKAARLDLSLYDFHISASEAGRRGLEAMLAEEGAPGSRQPFVAPFYLRHNQSLDGIEFRDPGRFSPVYLGAAANAAIPPSIADEITVHEVLTSADMARAVRALGGHNFHFAVRPNPEASLRRRYAPFTKGFTAAACRSNILVNRQVDDAVDFLGPDYPYLVDSNAPEDVTAGFRKAAEEFGGPEWNRGLEIMRSIRDRVSGPAQAQQFVDIVTRAVQGDALHLPTAARSADKSMIRDRAPV